MKTSSILKSKFSLRIVQPILVLISRLPKLASIIILIVSSVIGIGLCNSSQTLSMPGLALNSWGFHSDGTAVEKFAKFAVLFSLPLSMFLCW